MPFKEVDLDQYPDSVVEKAFWLQEHIRRYGIDAIHFSHRGRNVARLEGPDIVAEEISKEFQKL